MVSSVTDIVVSFLRQLIAFLPNFFGGLIIFFIGLLIAELLRRVFRTLLRFLRVGALLEKANLMKTEETDIWEGVIAEIIRWTAIILFLIPTLEAWGLSRATVVLNEFLLYIPNVIIAVIIGFIGIILGNLVSDVVMQSTKALHKATSRSLALSARGAVLFFTILVVLNQLGVAQDLIRILFTGIVAMIALAGGLAFGLGGREAAKDILTWLLNYIKHPPKEGK